MADIIDPDEGDDDVVPPDEIVARLKISPERKAELLKSLKERAGRFTSEMSDLVFDRNSPLLRKYVPPAEPQPAGQEGAE